MIENGRILAGKCRVLEPLDTTATYALYKAEWLPQKSGFGLFTGGAALPSEFGWLAVSDHPELTATWQRWKTLSKDVFVNAREVLDAGDGKMAIFFSPGERQTIFSQADIQPLSQCLQTLQQQNIAWEFSQQALTRTAAGWRILPLQPLASGDSLEQNRMALSRLLSDTFPEPLSKWETKHCGTTAELRWTAAVPGPIQFYQLDEAGRKALPEQKVLPRHSLSLQGDALAATNPVTVTLNGVWPTWVLPLYQRDAWVRLGQPLRLGGPEEVTLRRYYFNEGDLVLEFNWPDSVERVEIVAAPNGFARRTADGPGVYHGVHHKYNPLRPLRIPLLEFAGWEQIYLRIFAVVRDANCRIFSVGSGVKIEIPQPPS